MTSQGEKITTYLQPTAALIGAAIGILMCFIRDYLLTQTSLFEIIIDRYPILTNDLIVVVTITIALWLICMIANLYAYLIDGEYPSKGTKNKDLSQSKYKALHPKVPKAYLSQEPDGFTLGKYNNKYFRLPINKSNITHTLILGSPGSGKSTTLLTSLLWSFNFASQDQKLVCYCIDVKPELSFKSVDESREDIHIINPSVTTGYGWDVWYGLDEESSDDELIERADQIARAIIVNPNSSENVFFYASAQILLKAFLVYGFRKGDGFADSIAKIIHTNVQDLITEILMDEDMDSHPKIIGMVRRFEGKTSNAMQDVEMTLQMELSIFEIDSVKYQFQDNPKMASPVDLMNGISIFVAIPDHLLSQYSAIFRLMTVMTLKYLSSVPDKERSKDNAPVIWLLLDEFGSINKVDGILEGLARLRSRKITIWLAIQSMAQLDMTYGDDGCRAIVDNCENTIVFSCRDKKTTENLSSWAGQYEEKKQSINKKAAKSLFTEKSFTDSNEFRNVIDASDILNLRQNNMILVFTEGNRYLIDKYPYYRITMLNEKSKDLIKKNEEVDDNVQAKDEC